MGCTPDQPIWFFDNERLLTTSDRLNLAHPRGTSILPQGAKGDGPGRLALQVLEWQSASYCPIGSNAHPHTVFYVLRFNGKTMVSVPR